MVISRTENVEAESFLSLHVNNIEDYEKQEIVINIYFEDIVTSIFIYFHERMVDFVNKIQSSDKKYQNNEMQEMKIKKESSYFQ